MKDKGVETLIKVFTILGKLEKIIFVGDGYQGEELRKKYPRANLIGRVNHEKVYEYLINAKYFMSASVMEGLSYALIEAMEIGVVPIISQVEGHIDLIINGYNGYCFNGELDLINFIFKSELISNNHYQMLSENCKETSKLLQKIGKTSIQQHFNLL